ncbi:hypothetical protein DU508_22245 [Pedobacter chinensis]|uniref:DUF4369 domain-containing protein n=1 Tax=Pedobacter chinensis TaxID=2282421 RepID=A0A369PUQ1_9SPHI|nr:hypothetical protein [Pedobacter chinensis]RDC54439.1 hypothetical protein DU508_22245 [Pedobacter chinensis]
MKTFCTLIFCFIISLAKAQLPSDTLITYITFENLKSYASGYGTSIERPIGSGAFINIADRGALQIRMAKLESSFRWPDGSTIDFSKRGSISGKNGIVDQYTLTNPVSKTTVTLYVDPYHTDSTFYVPEGLIVVNAEILAKEIQPHLKKIEELDAAKDPYADLKEMTAQELNYMAMKIGIAAFIDHDNLRKLMTDTQATNELKIYLFNSYILHKFYALGKNLPTPKEYAFNKMKEDFLKFQKNHPDVESGNVKIHLNE